MRQLIHLGDKPIILVYPDNIDEINVEEITKIDYSNLYGEVVTISALLNTIGGLRSEAEAEYESKKLERKIMEANLEKRWRKEAGNASGKFTITEPDGSSIHIKLTEKAIVSAITGDKGWQVCMSNEIKAQKDLNFVDSLFWSLKSKDQKLNNLLPKVAPREFVSELVEGKINGILIQKP